MAERVFRPIGIESLTWETLGLDDGDIGQHTNPFSGAHVSARELARIGYLMLRRGVWAGQSLVPPWWIDLSTRTSQAANGRYGLTWWVNTQGTLWPAATREAYSALGYNTNLCTVIPSLGSRDRARRGRPDRFHREHCAALHRGDRRGRDGRQSLNRFQATASDCRLPLPAVI